jgi:hypothetical protein
MAKMATTASRNLRIIGFAPPVNQGRLCLRPASLIARNAVAALTICLHNEYRPRASCPPKCAGQSFLRQFGSWSPAFKTRAEIEANKAKLEAALAEYRARRMREHWDGGIIMEFDGVVDYDSEAERTGTPPLVGQRLPPPKKRRRKKKGG